jgi:hypothetical protein
MTAGNGTMPGGAKKPGLTGHPATGTQARGPVKAHRRHTLPVPGSAGGRTRQEAP